MLALVLGVAALLGPAALGAAGPSAPAPTWRDVSAETGADAVPPRAQHGLATDPVGNAYLYGGAGAGARAWRDLTASASQAGVAARQDHGWELDPVSGDLYLFGGIGGTSEVQLLNDFWRYDVSAGRWEELTAPAGAAAISPRELYDVSADGRGGLYLFGGVSGQGFLSDFWHYDGADATWHDVSAASGAAAVPGRHYYVQAADGDFYVLGGYARTPEGTTVLGDLWRHGAATETWEPVAYPGQDGVLPRIPYVLAYQAATDSLITFGGADAQRRALNDAWVLELGDPPAAATPGAEAPTPTEEAGPIDDALQRLFMPVAS